LVLTKFQLHNAGKPQVEEPVGASPSEWSSDPAPLALAAAASSPLSTDVLNVEPELMVPVDEIYPEPHQDVPQF